MKVHKTYVSDGITWVYFGSTLNEVEQARTWCQANKTQYVIYGKSAPTNAGQALGLQNRVAFARGDVTAEVDTYFGFKAAQDAVRFRLSMA